MLGLSSILTLSKSKIKSFRGFDNYLKNSESAWIYAWTIFWQISLAVSPVKGYLPVASKYNSTPRDQISDSFWKWFLNVSGALR